MKIYLSGPMTGIEEFNYPEFNRVAQELREKGLEVVNPAEIEPIGTGTWEDYMKADIKALVECDTVAVLNGWKNSKGAKLEVYLGQLLGFRIIDAETLETIIVDDETDVWLLKAIEHFGEEAQKRKAVEELLELGQAILKDMATHSEIEHIYEEIADVEIMLQQLRMIYNIQEVYIDEFKKEKLERLAKRIGVKQCI